jgi:hypothetical protein
MIQSFAQMMLSRDDKVRKAMRWFADSEWDHRGVGRNPNSRFLDWGDEPANSGTASIVGRTKKACEKLEIGLKLRRDTVTVITLGSEYNTKTATGLGHFLTQKVIRVNKVTDLMKHPVHGASFVTLQSNEVSNKMLTNVYTRRSDAFFRFTVVGRADCLPTPANLFRWFRDQRGGTCRGCGEERHANLAHILNGCRHNFGLYTIRHNRLAGIIQKEVIKYVNRDLRSEIQQNVAINIDGLSDEVRNLRPDMIFERRRLENRVNQGRRDREIRTREGIESTGRETDDTKMMEIIEFSCPYGYIAHGRNKLEQVYEEKQRKYEELRNEISRLREEHVRVTVVIVSSMGAVHKPSLKDLQKVLKCNDRELQKLGQQMSESVILGSMEIWRQNARQRVTEREEGIEEGAMPDEGERMIQREPELFEGDEIETRPTGELADDIGDEDEHDRTENGIGNGNEI